MKHYYLLFIPLILVLSSSLLAQDSTSIADTMYYLSPVVINPTQARERETPATFSNLTQKHLSERYSVQDIPQLLSELPSITWYSENGNGIGYNYLNLRGFDQRRISVMINGIPQNDPEDHNVYWIDFPDLAASTSTIQVQRGAGSAFYGPPAIGGSVNLVTTPFSQKRGITFESVLGVQEFGDSDRTFSLSTKKFEASINSGLIDGRYMLYGKLANISSDGYRHNSWVDLNSYFLAAVRLDNSMTTRFHFFGGPFSDGLAYTGLPQFANGDKKLRRQNLADWGLDSTGKQFSYTSPRRQQETEKFSQPHFELIHDWRLSSTLILTNTLFYYTGDGYFDYDGSWIPYDGAGALPWFQTQVGFDSTLGVTSFPSFLIRAFVGNSQWGWLPHLDIDHGNGTLTLGTEIRFHRSTHWGKIQFAEQLPAGIDPDFHFYEYNGAKDIFSTYIHELFRPKENVTVMADLQFVRNRYGIQNEKFLGNDFNFSYFFVNPRFGLNDNIDQEWNVYCSIGYTSREPRLRNLYAAEDSYFGATPQFAADTTGGHVKYDFDQPLAKPERLLDVELGTAFRGGTAQFSANVFWMEFMDELVQNGQVDIFGQPVTGNAERSRHLGVELEGSTTVFHGLTAASNLSLSSNKLIRYSVLDNGLPRSLDGNPISGFPDLLGNLRLTYLLGSLNSSVLVKYVGTFYTDNFKNEDHKNADYTVVDASFLYQVPRIADSDLTIRCEIRNLFNRLYFTNGEGERFFPAAERNYVFGIAAHL